MNDGAAWAYHAAPLHYVPHILRDGALYAQSVLESRGEIAPRPTARRRDRMLGLTNWVHLSPKPATPLLRDKLRRGYPHVLFVFPLASVLSLPETALLPYNAKAWHSKAAFQPVTAPDDKARLLQTFGQGRRFRSLELLVKYGLDLALASEVAFYAEGERALVAELLPALSITPPLPLTVDFALFGFREPYAPTTGAAIAGYFARCAAARTLLPPPPIPFD